jgi:FkbM family methyltransferase
LPYYFPNRSPKTIALEQKFRSAVAQAPEEVRYSLYEAFTSAHPELVETIFAIDSEFVIAQQEGRAIYFPRPLPLIKFSHLSCGYEEWLKRKYSMPGFVEVEPGDVVIDCGSYVGGFSLSAARVAQEVHAFEPEDRNFSCLSRNLSVFRNVVSNKMALYNETGFVELNISKSSVEHSILVPDDGPPITSQRVRAVTLVEYCASRQLEKLDFVKIEAEGVELEVFAGLGEICPNRLAIDVSPERNGTSPADELCQLLRARRYEVRLRGHVLFAKLSN